MTRRALLASLLNGGAALALDPERLLWRPGAKMISVPRRDDSCGLSVRFMQWSDREGVLHSRMSVFYGFGTALHRQYAERVGCVIV